MKQAILISIVGAMALVVTACTPSVTVESLPPASVTVESLPPASVTVEGPPAQVDGAPTGISVSGTGNVTGTPDTLTMSFGVSVRRKTVGEAVSDAAERSDAIIASLKNSGVLEENIQTTNYSIYPEYDYRNNRERLIGYQVNNTVAAKIRDLEKAGSIIDDVATAGGDEVRVSGVSFSIEDNQALIEAARAAAWEDAEAKAKQLAELAGVTLGTPTTISENFTTQRPPVRYDEFAAARAEGDFTTPIAPGGQQVAVTLSVQFAIEG